MLRKLRSESINIFGKLISLLPSDNIFMRLHILYSVSHPVPFVKC